jgi:hypothetical protein
MTQADQVLRFLQPNHVLLVVMTPATASKALVHGCHALVALAYA